ncbi:hypothetical protein [Nocardia brasiliensis]|uniref:hypothetical protein n=1 Tax=Nocardia brasiliensis TaxID=37326 RepID=UPI002455E0DC|nr:hypothetical protein [Nocardia brasiliensis]
MTLTQNEVEAAALAVVRHQLARGVSHVQVEMILNGAPSGREWSVGELGQVRERVSAMYAAYLTAITPEAVA